jgi:hypothetical protein
MNASALGEGKAIVSVGLMGAGFMFPSDTRAFLEQQIDDGSGQDIDDNLALAILPNTIKGMVSSRSFEGNDCVRYRCLGGHIGDLHGQSLSQPAETPGL